MPDGPERLTGTTHQFSRVSRQTLAKPLLDRSALRGGVDRRHVHAHADTLTTMPGVSAVVAHVIVAEIGVDMARFPTAGHLVSWAGLCPRNDESAGKRRSTRVRKGANWLKTTLVTAAWAAVHKHDSYLRAQFLRIKGRRR